MPGFYMVFMFVVKKTVPTKNRTVTYEIPQRGPISPEVAKAKTFSKYLLKS